MTPRIFFGLFAAVLAQLAYTPGVARAQVTTSSANKEEIARHAQLGQDFFDASDFERARAEFHAAYRLSGDPTHLYNVAQALEKLHRYIDAAATYRNYVKLADARAAVTPEEKQKILDHVQSIESMLGELIIAVSPPDAKVTVDGRHVEHNGTVRVPVEPGKHRVHASKTGYLDHEQTDIEVASKQHVGVPVALKLASTEPRPADETASSRPAGEIGRLSTSQGVSDISSSIPSRWAANAATGSEEAVLHIAVTDPDVTIAVDGIDRGPMPLDLRVLPGRHDVVARRDGHKTGSISVNLDPGQKQGIRVESKPRPANRWWIWGLIGTAVTSVAGYAIVSSGPLP